jgi:hypothetical protein
MKGGSRDQGLLDYQVSRWTLGAYFIWDSTVESEKKCVGFVVIGNGAAWVLDQGAMTKLENENYGEGVMILA